jgi:phosphate-selective porin OprO/OprP
MISVKPAAAIVVFLLFASLSPPLSAQAPPAEVKAGGRSASLLFGGLIQAQAEGGDRGDSRFATANDRFYLRRARLNATGKFLEEFDFRLEIELTGTLGETSNLRAQATDAYITWNKHPGAQVRFGQFKSPFGYEQLYGDPRLPTIERTLVNDRLTFARQIGMMVFGDLLDKRFSYAAGIFNGNSVNTTGNDNDEMSPYGRISAQLFRGPLFGKEGTLALGINGYSSEDAAVTLAGLGFDSTPATAERDNIFAGKRDGFGCDLQLKAPGGGFEVWAEYLEGHFEPINGRPGAELDAEGWSLQASYFVVADKIELVARHEIFDPSTAVDDNDTTIETLGVNYFYKGHDVKAMLNVLQVDDQLQADTATRILLRMQVIF